MTRSNLAIEASGLVKVFGDVRAVDGVDLAVPTGSVYGVLGPNGAGKTTTIRMLATLIEPDEGSAQVLGHDVKKEADAVRGLVSLTGQMASVDEDLTGRENLVLLGWLLGLKRPAAKARADELLDAFGLEEAASRLVKHYSGGMRRRLDIAASIVVTPELLFLDEPTTGLDPRSRNQVWDIIRALRAEGTTILLCTQYLDEADQLADGIAVIDHGRVIAEGTPGQLKASVGSGALHVRLLNPGQRAEAELILAQRARRRAAGARSVGADRPVRGRRARRHGRRRAGAGQHRPGRLHARPAEPRRGLPRADRPSRRGQHDRGGGEGMSVDQMSTDQAAIRSALSSTPRPPRVSATSAAIAFGWRGMLKVRHVPEQLLDVTITPVMFVLMFTYLFGGAISGLDRRVPGLHPPRHPRHVRAVHDGLLGRLAQHGPDQGRGRPLPDAADRPAGAADRRPARRRGALPGGGHGDHRAGPDPRLPPEPPAFPGVAAALGLTILFAFALSWVFTTLGLIMRTPSAVMNAGFMGIFPLTFLSNVFVDPETLPSGLQAFVEVNPISILATASRGLMEGNADGTDILIVLGTAVVLTAIFAPLTTHLYRTRS